MKAMRRRHKEKEEDEMANACGDGGADGQDVKYRLVEVALSPEGACRSTVQMMVCNDM